MFTSLAPKTTAEFDPLAVHMIEKLDEFIVLYSTKLTHAKQRRAELFVDASRSEIYKDWQDTVNNINQKLEVLNELKIALKQKST